MQINETRVVVDGKPVTSSPKTGAGRRSVPLDPSLVALLRTHKATQAQERWAAREAYGEGGYVIADELGRPYHPDTISAWFDDAVKAAKLPRIRLMTPVTLLRRSCWRQVYRRRWSVSSSATLLRRLRW